MVHHPEVDGVRCLTPDQARDVLGVDVTFKLLASLPKIRRGLYIADVVELARRVRLEARIGYASAIRVAIAIHEKRLP